MEPGSLVVCINDKNQATDTGIYPNGLLVEEEIYTVKALWEDAVKGFILEEKPVIYAPNGSIWAHKASRFKEVQPPIGDILKQLLEESLYQTV